MKSRFSVPPKKPLWSIQMRARIWSFLTCSHTPGHLAGDVQEFLSKGLVPAMLYNCYVRVWVLFRETVKHCHRSLGTGCVQAVCVLSASPLFSPICYTGPGPIYKLVKPLTSGTHPRQCGLSWAFRVMPEVPSVPQEDCPQCQPSSAGSIFSSQLVTVTCQNAAYLDSDKKKL